MLAAGLMTIMCSLEICLRLYKANKRVQDPDLDNLTNPHEVKHWMDPNIIPYGWGLFNRGEHEKKGEGSRSCVMIPILSLKKNMGKQVSINLFSCMNCSKRLGGIVLFYVSLFLSFFPGQKRGSFRIPMPNLLQFLKVFSLRKQFSE